MLSHDLRLFSLTFFSRDLPESEPYFSPDALPNSLNMLDQAGNSNVGEP